MTRGIKNNNPTNIRRTVSNDWKGKRFPWTDRTFEEFTEMEYGIRAAIKVLNNYRKTGAKTIEKIIERWAPRNENNTNAYIGFVCKQTRIPREKEVNEEEYYPILKAMCRIESNYKLTKEMYEKAKGLL